MGEWLLSRRDNTIVARHEVPLQFGHLQGIRCEIAPTKGRHVSARGFNPKSANLMRGLSMGEWLLSRRDGAIVAWHEVPGTPPKRGPSRRVRCDSCRRAHRFDDWSDEVSNRQTETRRTAVLSSHSTHCRLLMAGVLSPGTSCQATIGVVPPGHRALSAEMSKPQTCCTNDELSGEA